MVLVEEGPWTGPVGPRLRRIQERLYGCLDAALDGHFAAQFPDSSGRQVIIQLDCYEVPKNEVEAFFREFSTGVLTTGDYASALANNKFVNGIVFEVNFDGPTGE